MPWRADTCRRHAGAARVFFGTSVGVGPRIHTTGRTVTMDSRRFVREFLAASPRVSAAFLGALLVAMSWQVTQAQQSNGIGEEGSMLTYSRGQAVIPIYNGWHPLPDGTIE